MRTRFSFLILISAFLPRLFGQTTVAGGTISGVLSFTNSPFLITGNLNVPAGKSLTIEPGVEMRFMGSYELSVSGKIRARGNTTGRILFTSPDSLVGWRGLRVDPFVMEKDSCVFSFCDFKNGLISDRNDWSSFGVLTIKNTALVIVDNCSFNSNRSGSVFCKDAHFSVMASVFKYNLGGQILTVNCTANIGGNSLI